MKQLESTNIGSNTIISIEGVNDNSEGANLEHLIIIVPDFLFFFEFCMILCLFLNSETQFFNSSIDHKPKCASFFNLRNSIKSSGSKPLFVICSLIYFCFISIFVCSSIIL